MENEETRAWEAASESDFLVELGMHLSDLDWISRAANSYWRLRGKKEVRFDYRALLRQGMNGANLEKILDRQGIRVYSKALCSQGAAIMVDRNKEGQVRRFFAKLGILL